ncbi:unnamed protein product, partial [marine sediment metagenome]
DRAILELLRDALGGERPQVRKMLGWSPHADYPYVSRPETQNEKE